MSEKTYSISELAIQLQLPRTTINDWLKSFAPYLEYEMKGKRKEYNQNACAITDHSSCAGWIEFDQVMQDNQIKPIFGNEFYCRDSYNEPKTRDRDHLVMLAMNQEGLENIRRFQRIAVENFYYKPILSYECLQKYGVRS